MTQPFKFPVYHPHIDRDMVEGYWFSKSTLNQISDSMATDLNRLTTVRKCVELSFGNVPVSLACMNAIYEPDEEKDKVLIELFEALTEESPT
jgi:hypothetical protein